MREDDIRFLEGAFKKYYFERSDLIQAPERPSEREFGYQKLGSGMVRHISVQNDKELRLLLMQNVPSDVYCSNGYYTFPSLPMREKDWKEADLIFDIDAKDLNMPCGGDNAVSVCSECGGVSASSETCPKCGSTKLEKKCLACRECIDHSKKEVSKLSEILTDDLSVDIDDIHVYFSGNEGFHIYVYNSPFQQAGSRERSELVDYIMFKGAIPEKFGMKKFKPDRKSFPDFGESGWRGRFSRHVYGSKSKRSKVISELVSDGYSEFQKTLDDMAENAGARIDPSVTMDIHRVFRLPGSINSKSGLAKIRCEDLEKFDAYAQAALLGDEKVEVLANCPVTFKLGDKKFGPYSDEKTSVPAFAAAYMILKKLATIA